MRKSILLFVLFTLTNIPLLLFAQGGYQVKGHIVSAEDNEPMIGVSVQEKGTTNGVITDIDGNYTLEIKGTASATLLFSYAGMQSQQHVVNARTGTLIFRLVSDAALIDEVVVVAYGTRKKGTIAGAVSTVKAEKMENVPAAGFDLSLEVHNTCFSVFSNSGVPSKSAVFLLRGTNSINSGTSPLFILDGVPISSADFNTISPGDIESISVLKDASSTSIYGARAANGVVVITSKRGLAIDKAKVTMRAQWGFSQLASDDKWVVMNTAERIQFEKEIGLDTGQDYDLLSRTDVDWLSNLKLRAGYGLTGNQDAIAAYNSLALYQPSGLTSLGGSPMATYAILRNANPDLRWEVKKTFDVGFDFGVMNGRYSLTADWYHSKTSDMLYMYDVPVPPFVYPSLLANMGEMTNTGIELAVNAGLVQTKDFDFNLGMNISWQKNKLNS